MMRTTREGIVIKDNEEYARLKQQHSKNCVETLQAPECVEKRVKTWKETFSNKTKEEIKHWQSRPGAINGRAEQVICTTTKEVYNCKKEAAKATGINYKKLVFLINSHTPDKHGNYYEVLGNKTCNVDIGKKRQGGGNPAAKAVMCIETKEVFETLKAANEHYKFTRNTISDIIKHNKKDKNGHTWRYLDE